MGQRRGLSSEGRGKQETQQSGSPQGPHWPPWATLDESLCIYVEISALDFLFEYLIKIEFKDKKYFDFGTSTEDNGNFLNKGLIFQKEGFGARGIVYKQYIYNIK